MNLEEYLGLGIRLELGSHTFEAEEIKRFASKFDPQRFHMDEEAARQTVFGHLCASGWHTAAVWMRFNVAKPDNRADGGWTGEGNPPTFGPSPGIRNLKWMRPVYEGDTITYYRTGQSLRSHPGRTGWKLMTALAEGVSQDGAKVIEFTSNVLVHTGQEHQV